MFSKKMHFLYFFIVYFILLLMLKSYVIDHCTFQLGEIIFLGWEPLRNSNGLLEAAAN